MEDFCKARHHFISEIYELSEAISGFGIYSSSIILILSQAINLTFLLFAKEILLFAARYSVPFVYVASGSFLYTVITIMLVTINYLISKFEFFKKKTTREKVKAVIYQTTSYLVFPLEFIIYEIKSIVFAVMIMSEPLHSNIESKISSNILTWIYYTVIVDFSITVVLCYFKCQFMRQEIPDGSYFSRIPGKFENVYLLVVPIIKLFGIWNNIYVFSLDAKSDTDIIFLRGQNQVDYSYFFIILVILLAILAVFMSELPFYNSTCERVFAHTISTAIVVHAAIGITNYGYNQISKIVCLMMPLQYVLIEVYLEYYYDDKVEISQGVNSVSRSKIKMIITENIGKHSKNALKNKFLKRILSRKSKLQLEEQEIMDNIVEERELKLIDLMRQNGIDIRDLELSKVDSGIVVNLQPKVDIKDDIYYMIISRFVEDSNFEQNRCLMKIDWMLKKKLIIQEVLNLLSRILQDQESFKAKYVCYYALKLVEKKLSFFYRMKEQTENGYKDLNNVGLDLMTVITYKKFMSRQVNDIETFANQTKTTLQTIMGENAPLRNIYESKSELYALNQKITSDFNILHENTLKTEYFHLIPYFYHQLYNINLYRSSKKYYQIFISRIAEVKKGMIESQETKLNNLSVLYKSTTFLCDSDKSSLSLIRNVYGNKSNKYQSCVDKYPDVILPKVQNHFHYQAMNNYMMSDSTSRIRNINSGFTRMPNDHLIMKSVIIIKIVPNLRKEFNFLVNLMEKQNSDDFFILVGQDLLVDSYSKNLSRLVEKRFLNPGVHIESVSQKAFDFINRVIAEARENETKLISRTEEETGGTNNPKNKQNKSDSDIKSLMSQDEEISKDGNKIGFILGLLKRREEFTEELVFGSTRKSQPKMFQVRIEFNSFKYISGGYFLLRLREVNSLNRHYGANITKKLEKRIRENEFVLSFTNAEVSKSNMSSRAKKKVEGSKIKPQLQTEKEPDHLNLKSSQATSKRGSKLKHQNLMGSGLASADLSEKEDEPNSIESPDFSMKSRKVVDKDKNFGINLTNKFYNPQDENRHKNPTNRNSDERPVNESSSVSKNPVTSSNKQPNLKLKKIRLTANKTTGPKKNTTEKTQLIKKSRSKESSMNEKDSDGISVNSVHVNYSEMKLPVFEDERKQENEKSIAGSSAYLSDGIMGYKHNRMMYEDVCTKKDVPFEVAFIRGHLALSTLFVIVYLVAIISISLNLSSRFDDMKELYLSYMDFKFSINFITNQYLHLYGAHNGDFSDDRYSNLGIPEARNFTNFTLNQIDKAIDDFPQKFQKFVSVSNKEEKMVTDLLFNSKFPVADNFIAQSIFFSENNHTKVDLISSKNFSLFEGLALETYSKIVRLIKRRSMNGFKMFYLEDPFKLIQSGYYLMGQYFLLYGPLNHHPMSTADKTIIEYIDNLENASMNGFLGVAISAVVINLLLGVVKLLLVRYLIKKMSRVFDSFHLISDFHLGKRGQQLVNTCIIMRDIRENNFMVLESHDKENSKVLIKKIRNRKTSTFKDQDLLSFKIGSGVLNLFDKSQLDVNTRSKRVRYSKDSYFFKLTNSIFVVALKFLIVFGFILGVYFEYRNYIESRYQVFVRKEAVTNLGLDSIMIQNLMLADYLINDSDNQILNNKKGIEGIEAYFSQATKNWFERVETAFKFSDNQNDNQIEKYRKQSSCSYVDSLSVKLSNGKQICDFGTLQFGKMSMHLGFIKMYRENLDSFQSIKDKNSHEFKKIQFDKPRNIEWEFYLNSILYPTKQYFVERLSDKSGALHDGDTSVSLANRIVLWTFVFFLSYFVLSTASVMIITKQIRVARFAFQIYSMMAVLDNGKIKNTFIEFFKVANRDFI